MKTLIKIIIVVIFVGVIVLLLTHFLSGDKNTNLLKSNINAQNKDGLTPLMIAITKLDPEKVTQLLENGADPNLHTLGPSDGIELHRYYDTALHLAAMVPDPFYVKEILKYNPRIEEKDARGQTALDISLLDGTDENTKILLEYGANPNTVDNRGETPLIHAMQAMRKYPNIEIVKLLLSKGALLTPDPLGVTAIEYAETYENPQAHEVANLLRKHFKVK